MSSTATEVLDHDDTAPTGPARGPWKPWTRIAFRFCVTYFGLLCMLFAQLVMVFAGPLFVLVAADAIGGQMDSVDNVVRTVSTTVFRTEVAPLRKSYSGDQAPIWVLTFCVLVTAVAITAVWSILDRRRTRYDRLYPWFLTFVRLCLGGQLLFYGMAKVIPLQMPRPALATLLTPYGDFGPTAVLWNQVGSAPVYEMLLGAAEVLAGLLLFVPRTATAGALLSLVSLLQVFVLNMTFDVPVKLMSFHLVLMCLFILAPQNRRLANLLVLERISEPATQPPLFRRARANRMTAAVTAALGIWVLTGAALMAAQGYREQGGGAPEPPLYGIWNVTSFSIDGQPLPPLTTDETRWQRLVFDTKTTAYQKMDGSFVPADAVVDAETGFLTLTGPPHDDSAPPSRFPSYTYTFAYEQPDRSRLTLHGEIDGRPATITLEQLDPDSFPLRSRGFHWIQEYPYTGTLVR